MVRCILNGCTQELKLDTGSLVSILTDGMVQNICGAGVCRSYQKAEDYDNNALKFIDETTDVKNKNTTKQYFSCRNYNQSPLFGRDLGIKFN